MAAGPAPGYHPRAMTPASDRRALLVLVLGAMVIGAGPVLVRLAGAGPAAVAFWRLSFALPLLAVLARVEAASAKREGRPQAGWGRAVLLAGGLFAADIACWHYGIHYTSVANATVLSNLTPILLTAVAWLVFKDRPRPLFLAGLALAVGGAVLMGLAKGGRVGGGANPHLGDALSAFTAVWYAGYFLAVREARKGAGAATVMWRSSLVAAPCTLVVALVLREPLAPAALGGWAACVGLGLMHVTGQGAIAWSLGRLPAALTGVVVLVQPVVAALLGWAVFGEAVTPGQALGGALALAGVALAQLSTRGKPVAAPTAAAAA